MQRSPNAGEISPTSDNDGVVRPTIIELARRAAGLTQGQLAARAGTTQSAVSMYERRRKVPLLDVAERLMQAAEADLGMVTMVRWEAEPVTPISGFFYPSRLWRVEAPGCFDTVRMPDRVGGTDQEAWDLGDRDDRRRLYENLLVSGDAEQIMRWVDGALLIDLWNELDLPPGIRTAWEPAVRAGSAGRVVEVYDTRP